MLTLSLSLSLLTKCLSSGVRLCTLAAFDSVSSSTRCVSCTHECTFRFSPLARFIWISIRTHAGRYNKEERERAGERRAGERHVSSDHRAKRRK